MVRFLVAHGFLYDRIYTDRKTNSRAVFPTTIADACRFVQMHTSKLSEQDRIELNDALRCAGMRITRMSTESMEALLQREIARIDQPELVEVVKANLVRPRIEERDWDYGDPGQKYECWIVWEHPQSRSAVGYCQHGFGPTYPWGLLDTASGASLGMDCQWYDSVEDAVRESCAWDGPNPPGYEVS